VTIIKKRCYINGFCGGQEMAISYTLLQEFYCFLAANTLCTLKSWFCLNMQLCLYFVDHTYKLQSDSRLMSVKPSYISDSPVPTWNIGLQNITLSPSLQTHCRRFQTFHFARNDNFKLQHSLRYQHIENHASFSHTAAINGNQLNDSDAA